MKRFDWQLFFVGALLLGSVGGAMAQEAPAPPDPHFFDRPLATVHYVISQATKGQETLYFDHWGMRQASYRKAETAGFGTGNTINLRVGANLMTIDPDKNLGQKKVDEPFKQMLIHFNPAENKIYAVELLSQAGAVKIGSESVLGRDCDVWQNQKAGVKLWIWNGITLKSEIQSPAGLTVTTATQIDEATGIDEKVFNVPEGVHFVDMDINQILLSRLGKE